MTRPAALLIAMLAALLWAPSAVLAAPPNLLLDPSVTPASATAATPVTFSVHYRSSAGNAALTVSAGVGPLELPLVRTAGTPTDGTWSGTSLAPVGTWTVSFQATVVRGPAPSLDGPLLTVVPVTSPTPTPGAPQVAPSDGSSTSPYVDGAGASTPPSTNPEGAPVASGGSGGVVPTPAAEPGGQATAAAEPAGPAPPGWSHRAGPIAGSGAPAAAAESGVPARSSDPGLIEGVDDVAGTNLVTILAVVIGLATAALIGTGWLVTIRDRAEEEEAPGAAQVAARARRTAALRVPDEDPVIAALGLGREREARGGAPRRRPGRRG